MQTFIIGEQIIILGISALAGIYAARRGIITEDLKDGLTRIIFNITLPLLIITNLASIDLTPEIIVNSGLVIVFSLFSILIFYAAGKLSARIFGIRDHAIIHTLHTAFGNTVLLVLR